MSTSGTIEVGERGHPGRRLPGMIFSGRLAGSVAAVLTLLFALWTHHRIPDYSIEGDTYSYAKPGAAFWRGEGFVRVEADGRTVPEMYRTPVYPLLIGPFYAWWGPGWHWPVIALQALLRGLMVWLVMRHASRNGAQRAFLWSAAGGWLVALDPAGVVFGAQVLTETLAAFVMIAVVLLVLRARKGSNLVGWVVAGFLAGVNTLLRPINLAALPVLAVVVHGLGVVDGKGRWRSAALCGVFCAAASLAPALWMIRNAVYSGRPVLSLISSINLYEYRAAEILARREGTPLADVQARIVAERKAMRAEGRSDWEIAGIESGKAREIILSAPGAYVHGMLQGVKRTLLGGVPLKPGCLPRMVRRAVVYASQLHAVLLYALVSWLAVSVWRGGNPGPELLIGAALFGVLVLAAAGPEGYARFRVPLTPLLGLAIACGAAGNPYMRTDNPR